MGLYTAILKRDGDWWIGWIEEQPNDLNLVPKSDLSRYYG